VNKWIGIIGYLTTHNIANYIEAMLVRERYEDIAITREVRIMGIMGIMG